MKRLVVAAVLALLSVFVAVPTASAAVAPCVIRPTASPLGEHGWKFSARLLRNGKGYSSKRVHLDLQVFGDVFVDMDITRKTNDKGRATWTTDGNIPENDFVFRFRFDGNRKTLPCRSGNFSLPRR